MFPNSAMVFDGASFSIPSNVNSNAPEADDWVNCQIQLRAVGPLCVTINNQKMEQLLVNEFPIVIIATQRSLPNNPQKNATHPFGVQQAI
jgi:hypothetical protein